MQLEKELLIYLIALPLATKAMLKLLSAFQLQTEVVSG